MGSLTVFHVLALFGVAIVFIGFLVIVKTVNTISICLLRMEYLLRRELELVRERERIKQEILRQQQAEESRRRKLEEESDPLMRMPQATSSPKQAS